MRSGSEWFCHWIITNNDKRFEWLEFLVNTVGLLELEKMCTNVTLDYDWRLILCDDRFFIKFFFQRNKKYKLHFSVQNLLAVHISGYTVQWEYRKLPSILDWLEDLQTTVVIYHFKKAEKMRHFLKKMRRSWKKTSFFVPIPSFIL